MENDFTKHIYSADNGYAYKIKRDEVDAFVQEFKPGVDGFQPMTELEANQYADDLIWELTQPHIQVATDKPQITADGQDTAIITATVNNPASTETIELWQGETLIDSEQATNGQAQFQITMTEPGTLTLTVRSTTKYGQNTVTIEGV